MGLSPHQSRITFSSLPWDTLYLKIDQIENAFQDYAAFNFLLSFFPDWEATNEAIEEQVARESYFQWLRDNERRQVNSFKN